MKLNKFIKLVKLASEGFTSDPLMMSGLGISVGGGLGGAVLNTYHRKNLYSTVKKINENPELFKGEKLDSLTKAHTNRYKNLPLITTAPVFSVTDRKLQNAGSVFIPPKMFNSKLFGASYKDDLQLSPKELKHAQKHGVVVRNDFFNRKSHLDFLPGKANVTGANTVVTAHELGHSIPRNMSRKKLFLPQPITTLFMERGASRRAMKLLRDIKSSPEELEYARKILKAAWGSHLGNQITNTAILAGGGLMAGKTLYNLLKD